jgi:hypothetical protein
MDPPPDGLLPVGRDVHGAVLAVEAEAEAEGTVPGVGLLLALAVLLAAVALDLHEIAAKQAGLAQEISEAGVEPRLLVGEQDGRRHRITSRTSDLEIIYQILEETTPIAECEFASPVASLMKPSCF